jgi:tRNA threonylcarbamoyladenosine biosynthesis protein TsaB
MVEVLPQQVVEIDKWLQEIQQLERPVLFLGEDVERYRETIVEQMGVWAHFGVPAENIPRPGQLAWLVYQKWNQHEPPEHADFTPNYLQLTEAEANWLKKQGKEGQAHG